MRFFHPRRGRPLLRLGLILTVAWLLLVGLWPLLYPFHLRARVEEQVAAIQAVVGPPDRPDRWYPTSIGELKDLCRQQGVVWKEDTRLYRITYDPRRGLVGYRLKPEGLLLREHMTIVVYQRVQEVLIALVLLMAAAGFGQRLLRWMRVRGLTLGERMLFGVGLGLGVMALFTLLVGVLGLLRFWVFVGAVLLMGLVGAGPLVDDATELYRGWRRTITRIGLWSGLMVAAGILFVALPLLGAFGPPSDYDALEYHLAAPAEYYLAGRITRLEGNCYSNFPFNIEMLYLMSMVLRRGVMPGTYLARVLNVLFGLLCGLSVWSFSRRFFRLPARGRGGEGSSVATLPDARAGAIGCLFFLSCPWFFWVLTTLKVYVTLGLAFFSFLAVYATLLYLEVRGLEGRGGVGIPAHLGLLVSAGIFVGLAMGSKYPAALFVAVPLVGWVGLVEVRRGLVRGGLGRGLARMTLFAAVSLLVVAPWLIKNQVLTGNPVYPLLWRVFGGVDWSAEQNARWVEAHRPRFDRGPVERLAHFFLTDRRMVVLVVLFLPFALVPRLGRGVVWWLIGYLLYLLASWYLLTNQIERMLFPGLLVMSALAGRGYSWVERTAARWFGRLALGGYLLYTAVMAIAVYSRQGDLIFEHRGVRPLDILASYQRRRSLGTELPVEAFRWLHQAHARHLIRLGPDSRLLLVGEAQTFYLTAYGQRHFIRNTVFDRNPFYEMMRRAGVDGVAAPREALVDLVENLRREHVRYILVNFVAIERFRTTYAFDFGGRRRPGYPEAINQALFDRLVAEGLLNLWHKYSADGKVDDPSRPVACVIYEVPGVRRGVGRR